MVTILTCVPAHTGEVLPQDTDELYTRRYETLTNLLSGQLSEYQEEEHTLRVLMKEEVKEKMSSQIGGYRGRRGWGQ